MNQQKTHKQVTWWLSILDNYSIGASGRKVGSFLAIVTAIILSFIYTNPAIVATIVAIWLVYSLVLFGIISGQQLVELKNGSTTIQETVKTETITTQEPTQ